MHRMMMSFYALTKNLGSSVGSTIMGYMYALKAGLFGSDLHNVLGLVSVISICLALIWTFLYRNDELSNT